MATKAKKKAESIQYGYALDEDCNLSSTIAQAVSDAEYRTTEDTEIGIFEVRRLGVVRKVGATYVPDA